MYYAQINDSSICVGVTKTTQEIYAANMIMLDSFDVDKLNRKYENGSWSEIKYEPETALPLNELEELKQENQELRELLADLTELVLMGGMGDE